MNDKITIDKDNDVKIPVVLFDHQDEGNYRYFPESGTKLIFVLKSNDGTEVQKTTINISSETEGIFIDIDDTITSGKYKYSLTFVNTAGKSTIICENCVLIIK